MSVDSRRHRRSIRLSGYDYSHAGTYFVTVCTQARVCLFGDVVDGEMQLNDAGRMIEDQWLALPSRFRQVEVDAFVVMPNHIHAILLVGAPLVGALRVGRVVEPGNPDETASHPVQHRAGTRPAPTTLGDVIGAFKSLTTVEYGRHVRSDRWPPFERRLWQRNYYEHIIRDEASLHRIRTYMEENPSRWEFDRENPACRAASNDEPEAEPPEDAP